jgi:hypothetical protein
VERKNIGSQKQRRGKDIITPSDQSLDKTAEQFDEPGVYSEIADKGK